jgi:hypothetical protein
MLDRGMRDVILHTMFWIVYNDALCCGDDCLGYIKPITRIDSHLYNAPPPTFVVPHVHSSFSVPTPIPTRSRVPLTMHLTPISFHRYSRSPLPRL